MIRRDHQNILLAKPVQDLRKLLIEISKRPGVTVNIIAVAVKHIIIHQIHETKPFKLPAKVL